ncbi:MAG: hypothetical protein Tsb0013_00310 [Phycisphaerales bacterium]
MTPHRTPRPRLITALALALVAGAATPLLAQEDDPRDERGRRIVEGMTTKLAFDDVTVEDLLPFIAQTTGKAIIPSATVTNLRITVFSDAEIPQSRALDLVFFALFQQGIAVAETNDKIILRNLDDLSLMDLPVIGADETTLGRTDIGVVADKVFRLTHSTAEDVAELIEEAIPDTMIVEFNEQSNTVVVAANIGLLQRVERIIRGIDQPSATSLETRTFRLRYADAEDVAQQIRDLFEDDGSGAAAAQQAAAARFFSRGGRGGDEGDSSGASPSENLRVTASVQQNAVTVVAETDIVEEIGRLIAAEWDIEAQIETVLPRVYTLRHRDPVKVQALLEGLFGEASASEDGGATASATRLAGQFSFTAEPDSGQLVVVAKSPDNLVVIDEIIAELDQPQTIGLPEIIELKHANAEELAEQLNALLAERGTIAQIPRQESGLDGGGTSVSPFASQDAQADDGADDETELITFWWQNGQDPGDARPSSSLIGRIRIVPVWRQNAVMVTAPPEFRTSITELVRQLDQPGRQVLLKAVVAEISLEDALALGLRWSSENISPNLQDNAFSVGTTTTGQQNDLLPGLFDTSVLDVNADLNLILQALDQNTDLNILSEPKIFTSDNQEAEFFDGQDIPFVTDSQTTDQGTVTQTTEYRAVGIQLSARPRITPNRDVDLRVNLELSSIQPTLTAQGQFIVDRRETTTQLIVGDGQTVVISGILRSEDREVVRKIPLLGDIPLIGALFTSTETEQEKTELVAFITPYVIENQADLQRVNSPYLSRLDALREQLDAPEENIINDAQPPVFQGPEPLAPGEVSAMTDEQARAAFRERTLLLERSDLPAEVRARYIREQIELRERLEQGSGAS